MRMFREMKMEKENGENIINSKISESDDYMKSEINAKMSEN